MFFIVLVILLIAIALFSIKIYSDAAKIVPDCGGKYPNNTPTSFTIEGSDELDRRYFMPSFESVMFRSQDDKVELDGWYIPAAKTTTKTVVVIHGVQGCKKHSSLLRIAGFLHHEGLNVLMFDVREHGSSEILDGLTTGGHEELQDVLGAVDWLQEQGVEKSSIGLAGGSLGAATALMAFGEDAELPAVWSDSSFASTEQVTEQELKNANQPVFFKHLLRLGAFLKTGVDLFSHSPIKSVSQLNNRPVQFVHVAADERMPIKNTEQLYEKAKQFTDKTDFWRIENGSGHVTGPNDVPDEYQKRIGQFFRAHLR